MRSKLGQDFWAGLMFAAFGIAAIAIARGYKLGTAAHMGPGYMPIAVGVLLILFGLALTARSLARGSLRVGELAWYATVLVLLGIFVFAFFVRAIGLAITTIIVVLACRAAGRYWNWPGNLTLAVALAIMMGAIFIFGLNLSLPLWPGQQ